MRGSSHAASMDEHPDESDGTREAIAQDGPALIEVDMVAVGPMATPFTGSASLVPNR